MSTRATKSLRSKIIRRSIHVPLYHTGGLKAIKVPHRREGWHYEIMRSCNMLTTVNHRLTKKMFRDEIKRMRAYRSYDFRKFLQRGPRRIMGYQVVWIGAIA